MLSCKQHVEEVVQRYKCVSVSTLIYASFCLRSVNKQRRELVQLAVRKTLAILYLGGYSIILIIKNKIKGDSQEPSDLLGLLKKI